MDDQAAEAKKAMDLWQARFEAGEVEYLSVGNLVACVPREQADAWDEIVAGSIVVKRLLGNG